MERKHGGNGLLLGQLPIALGVGSPTSRLGRVGEWEDRGGKGYFLHPAQTCAGGFPGIDSVLQAQLD